MGRSKTWAVVRLNQCNLTQVPDGPSMLEVLVACPWHEEFEARFVATQQRDARESFQKHNMLRKEKELAVLEKRIKGEMDIDNKDKRCNAVVVSLASK